MSIFEEMLSRAKPGTKVRIVQQNGDALNGVIIENDGTESLSLQISSVAVLRYSGVTGVEILDGGVTIPTVNTAAQVSVGTAAASSAAEKKDKPAMQIKVRSLKEALPELSKAKFAIPKVNVSTVILKNVYQSLLPDEKKKLDAVYNKFTSYSSSHDQSKLKELINQSWSIMDDMGWDYAPGFNKFHAYLLLEGKEYSDSAISFYYGQDMKSAYLVAYQGALSTKSNDIYALAGAMAVLCLCDPVKPELYEEAVEVLRLSAVQIADISYLPYIIENATDKARQLVTLMLWNTCNDLGRAVMNPGSISELTSALGQDFPGGLILNKLRYITGEDDTDGEEIDEEPEEEKRPAEKAKPAGPALKTIEGFVVSYDPGTGVGKLKTGSGKEFNFGKDIPMEDGLLEGIRSHSEESYMSLPVDFVIEGSGDSATVKSLKAKKSRSNKAKSSGDHLYSNVYIQSLMTDHDYRKLIAMSEEMLEKGYIEDGFFHFLTAHLALMNTEENTNSRSQMLEVIDKYLPKVEQNVKNLDVVKQVYSRFEMNPETLEILNRLIEMCPPDKPSRLLGYIIHKSYCYRKMGDFLSAIGQLLDWLEIVKRNNLSDQFITRSVSVYPDLAELYYQTGDLEAAKDYLEKSAESEKKTALVALIKPVSEAEDEEETDTDTAEDVPELSLDEYYDEYLSREAGLPDLSDENVMNRIGDFPKDRLYALLAWLASVKVAAELSGDDAPASRYSDEFTAADTVSATEKLFSCAFRSPISFRENFAADLFTVMQIAEKCIPDLADKLFAAATLRAMFQHCEDDQYSYFENMSILMSDKKAVTDAFPQLLPVFDMLLEFRQKHYYGLGLFAKYRTNNAALEQSVENAKRCSRETAERLEGHETMGRVRRLREILFAYDDSILKIGLDIVCANDVSKAAWLKGQIETLFIRDGKAFDSENISARKVDRYIDDKWIIARDVTLSEGYVLKNPTAKLISDRRTNIVVHTNRILTCICDWIEAAQNSAENGNSYAKSSADEIAPQICTMLEGLIRSCENNTEEQGFDWGTEAIRYVAAELYSKLDGTFNIHASKFFFIDFLRSADVLLDDNYLPDLSSTFCDLPALELTERIYRQATADLPSFEERLHEIFADDASKNNFRSAQLIRDYGEETGNTELSEHELFKYYDKCTASAKKRLYARYEDFVAEMELFEQYGTVSDVAGEKTRIIENITTWYHICRLTGDFGFYISIIDAYCDKIAQAAAKHGEHLVHQLDELVNDEYEFGVYPPEKIREYIDEQNFTVAENMLNCVRRGDVSEIADYSEEPFDYLTTFIGELATNYRATAIMSSTLDQSILKYAGMRDLEKAIRKLTGNATKDVRGGVNLINNWIVRKNAANGAEKVTKLLSLLGMPDCTVNKEEGSSEEIYLARRPLRTGKVTYSHPIAAFGSNAEVEDFRVLCLYGTYNSVRLLDAFRQVNTTAKHTIVFLDYPLNMEERRRLARKLKEEKSFAKTFLVVDRVLLFFLAKHYAANTVSRMLMAVAMPFAYYQPFVEKSKEIMPPELFTGREDALVSIEQPDGANLVYGGRQLGKSALLKMARHNVDGNANGDRAVLVEILNLDYKEAAKHISYRLIKEGILPDGSETDDWDTLTRAIEDRLCSDTEPKINYLLLMLDEADRFIESCKEVDHHPIALLKNLLPGRFKVVMAGLHNISRFNRDIALHRNSILVHLEPLVVKPFERPEAIKLLTNTLAYLGLRFTEESVISLILAKTNYFPGLIQLYCQKLLEAMRNSDYAGYGESNTPPYEITESHFKKVLAHRDFAEEIRNKLEMTLFVEEEGHSHYHIIALLLSYLHTAVPSEDGHTPEDVYNLAREHSINRLTSLTIDQVKELMHEMWDLNILTAKDEQYVFATEGFRELLGDQKNVEEKILEYSEEQI